MFWEIFRFELYYRRRRATTYVYFVLTYLVSFITIASPTLQVSGTADATSANAPYTIAVLMVVMSFVFSIITSSLLGVVIIRDVDHNMLPIIFTTRLGKGSYLFGRFAGSMVMLIIINTGIIFGALTAFLVGKVLPWEIAWKAKQLLPFDLWVYVQPFLLFVVSNIFITGSLFFAAGALVRRPVVIYSQGVALILIYQLANIFYLRDLPSQWISALLDPFGVQTFIYTTRYWTTVEQNTLLVPVTDALLYNRLIWIAISIIVLVLTWWRFSFTAHRGHVKRKKETATIPVTYTPPVPLVTKPAGSFSPVRQVFSIAKFFYRSIWTEVPFLVIVGTGLLVLLVNAIRMGSMYGTSSYPTTTIVLTMLNSFSLFFLIIMIFYSGEIVWKERQVSIQTITDATAIRNSIFFLSKFLSLCLVYITLLLGFMLIGVITQASRGYYQFNLHAYFATLFGETFISLSLVTVVSMLIQVLTSNRFLGFVLSILLVVIVRTLPLFGIEHEMVAYASGSLGLLSDMNGFGHFLIPFVWLRSYWAALAVLLFILAFIMYHRGNENKMFMRWKTGVLQLGVRTKIIAAIATVAFMGCGAYIYYNTSVLNQFESSRQIKLKQERHESELKKLKFMKQPTITEVGLVVDIHPRERGFEATGKYQLVNKTSQAITKIQLQHMISPHLDIHDVSFGRKAELIDDRKDLGYQLYEISPALAPGEDLVMTFKSGFTQNGFKSKHQNTDIVYNGTFLKSNYFPTIGYHANRIHLNVVVSTDSSQIAIAPGRLKRTWLENDRRFSQYETDSTISPSYALLSGDYAIKSDHWNDVDLNIFYHPDHDKNVDRMMQGLKDGLDYFTKNFGPFGDRQLTIVEVPRYTTAAQSFHGMIGFSEAAGFILKISDPSKDLDVPYYSTVHELAHQWWGQHVIPSDTIGHSILTEGISQYAAMMVMKKSFPIETMKLFLKYELDSYTKGRTAERMKEVPLKSVQEQQYISYNKTALVFFALQDHIGEDTLNMALRRFHEKFAFKDQRPGLNDLLNEISRVTPDSLHYLLGDMFEHITYYENKAVAGAYTRLPTGRYEVTMTVSTEKVQVNESGIDTPVALNDWIDVGIYGKNNDGGPKLIFLKKHKFNRQRNTLTIEVGEQPTKVGIDPLNKLIDHHATDNVIEIGTIVELANSPLGN